MSIEVDRRGIAIGRDTYLDWTLPDPQRFISGTHCEVQFRGGGYWLHDKSRNGTHVNEGAARITEPHLLKNGDRINIGQYIVAVTVTGEEANAAGGAGSPPPGSPYGKGDVWGGIDDAAEPGNRQDFRVGPGGQGPAKPIQGDAMEDISWGMQRVEEGGKRKEPPDRLPPLPGASAAPEGQAPAFDPALFEAPPSNAVPVRSDAGPAPSGDIWGAAPTSADTSPPASQELVLGARQERRPAAEEPVSGPAPEPRPEPPQSKAEFPPPPPATLQAEVAPEPASGQPSAGLAAQWTNRPDAPPDAAPRQSGGGEGVVAAFARGAGLPAEAFGGKDAEAFAEELGQLFRLTCDNLKAMLKARDETKGAMRSADRTMIGAIQNNPLKSLPTSADAMRVMFGPPTDSYLAAQPTIERSFADLKDHQIRVFSAMQQALKALIEDLSPDGIAETTPGDGGLASIVSSRRAKLWDIYVERYKSKSARHERGMVDAFMLLFSEMYDAQKRG